MGKSVFERPPNPVDEDRRVFLENCVLAGLTWQIGISTEKLLGMDEPQRLR